MSDKHFSGQVCVKGMIVKGDKVLISRDAHDKDIWELPGGHLNDGENIKDCLIRELAEELGVRVSGSRLIYTDQSLHVRDNANILFMAFSVELDSSLDPVLPFGGEIAEIRWVNKDEYAKLRFYDNCRSALNAYWNLP